MFKLFLIEFKIKQKNTNPKTINFRVDSNEIKHKTTKSIPDSQNFNLFYKLTNNTYYLYNMKPP